MGDLAKQQKAPGLAAACSLVLILALSLFGAARAQAPGTPAGNQPPAKPTYFEFGVVSSVGQNNIVLRTFDQQQHKTVLHSFVFAGDSRADVVRPGDNVEVVYSAGVDWTIRRLIMLNGGLPTSGPPEGDHREVPTAVGIHLVPNTPSGRVPAASAAPVTTARSDARTVSPPPRSATIPAAAAAGNSKAPAASSVALGSNNTAKSAPVIDVPLGADEAAMPKVLKPKEIAREVPLEECNRSSPDWPTQPLRLAVLDFRYPTEREESHDVGTTGGGSGTAVADLVFARLDQLNEFAMSRGDRTRLYRADFAGAARVGRELGVDAVLAGTFAPVEPPPGSDPDFPPPKSYELRAGIVDTCTGQLLMRLTSVICPDGLDPNAAANAPSCHRFAVTAKQATDPKDQARAFKQPIDALLKPLEHNGPPPGTQGSAGVVIGAGPATTRNQISIRLPAGSKVKAGDQVAVHAWRLTKNPTTYTLHNLHDEEIGRVIISNVQGGIATGAFTGDFPPRAGDTAELTAP